MYIVLKFLTMDKRKDIDIAVLKIDCISDNFQTLYK